MLARFQMLSELQSWRFGVTGQLRLEHIETVQFPLTPFYNRYPDRTKGIGRRSYDQISRGLRIRGVINATEATRTLRVYRAR